MSAVMHILRTYFPKWCLPRPDRQSQKHLQHHIFRQLQTNHPTTALVEIKPSTEQVFPKCRFMQYRRANEHLKRLGMVSEDGNKMVELSSITCAAPNMMDFIHQKYSMDNLQDSVEFMTIEDVEDVDLSLLPPIDSPGKIIGIDCNYVDNCDEQHISIPREPSFHVKFATSITGALDNIKAHSLAKHIDYGCQLAVVMGKKCREVTPKEALNHVFGFMVVQDIVARDWNALLGGHSMDTFLPLGPTIVHRCHVPDVNNLWIKTFINGEERQSGNTRNMIFKVDFLIHRLSQYLTLCPGDIILTGTPAGAGAYRQPSCFLKPGDLIESEIQNLGRMCNKVVNPYS
ncbi:fumarylacetoacetate hydrolase domain-containing protein 2A [Drosophila rhopaloa]|uniref:Fumarylacetoacetase-like C-terminal domain-containing protein n=2 Tax=Drosophila rhopaloa TaxID=1041015 RepID=A0ABM5J4Z7_DRORH|nr:fumarylacetoacetate hydrolase domain-containing protein 2A [Drosophila rhopaloa]